MDAMAPLFTFFSILTYAALAVKLWALGDAVIRPAPAYVAADKQTKNLWLVLLGISVVLGWRWGGGIFDIFVIVGLIVALVYLLDVRPAVREVRRHGGSNQGPYGPW